MPPISLPCAMTVALSSLINNEQENKFDEEHNIDVGWGASMGMDDDVNVNVADDNDVDVDGGGLGGGETCHCHCRHPYHCHCWMLPNKGGKRCKGDILPMQ
jgi:hypothetical protein